MNSQTMACSWPPALSDEDLFAVLDNIANEAVIAHLSTCPYCTRRLNVTRLFIKRLLTQTYRFDCPDVDQLASYVIGLLDHNGQATIEKHILYCSSCREELLTFQKSDQRYAEVSPAMAQAQESATTRFTRALRRQIASLIPLRPGLVLRGAEHIYRFTATAGATQVLIEAQERHDKWTLSGQIAMHGEELWSEGLVEIYSNEQLLLTGFIDELNEFAFDGLQDGVIDLILTPLTGTQIVIKSIPMQH